MDIKIGFTNNTRELTFPLDKDDQQKTVDEVTKALESDGGVLNFTDAKGNVYLVDRSQVAYVEVGTTGARPVGFN